MKRKKRNTKIRHKRIAAYYTSSSLLKISDLIYRRALQK